MVCTRLGISTGSTLNRLLICYILVVCWKGVLKTMHDLRDVDTMLQISIVLCARIRDGATVSEATVWFKLINTGYDLGML